MRLGRFGLDLDLWLRGWVALQRVVWAIILLMSHAAFKYVLAQLFEQELLALERLLRIIFGVAIISMEASLLLEAIRIFLPEPYGIKLNIDGDKRTDSAGSL